MYRNKMKFKVLPAFIVLPVFILFYVHNAYSQCSKMQDRCSHAIQQSFSCHHKAEKYKKITLGQNTKTLCDCASDTQFTGSKQSDLVDLLNVKYIEKSSFLPVIYSRAAFKNRIVLDYGPPRYMVHQALLL